MGKKSIFMALRVFFLEENMNSYILLHFENIAHHMYFYDIINSYMNSYNSYKNYILKNQKQLCKRIHMFRRIYRNI